MKLRYLIYLLLITGCANNRMKDSFCNGREYRMYVDMCLRKDSDKTSERAEYCKQEARKIFCE